MIQSQALDSKSGTIFLHQSLILHFYLHVLLPPLRCLRAHDLACPRHPIELPLSGPQTPDLFSPILLSKLIGPIEGTQADSLPGVNA